ncbi:MAG: S9 family peptidase [Chitinophagaceae bacterium]|nr:MAG: S9 family peptidase [Chitinophagaceae bacterium]
MRYTFLIFSLVFSLSSMGQTPLAPLTVDKIMRDPKWMGSSPSGLQWSADGRSLIFSWNPANAVADSLYSISPSDKKPVRVTDDQRNLFVPAPSVTYNRERTAYVFTRNGDVFYVEVKSGKQRQVTQTVDNESGAAFSFEGKAVVYSRLQNLYAWDLQSGETRQLTNFRAGDSPSTGAATAVRGAAAGGAARSSDAAASQQEAWLKKDQLEQLEVLKQRKDKKEATDAANKAARPKELRAIALEDRILQSVSIDATGRYISYILTRPATGNKTTIVPNYVTETGFTTDIPARTKVGTTSGVSSLYIFDRIADTVFQLKTDSIDGMRDIPAYVNDYPKLLEEMKKKNAVRIVSFLSPVWSPDGSTAMVDIRSDDNKDRWLMSWTPDDSLRLIDRQHDDAWIGGPGMFGSQGWIDGETCWFQSEKTGYSHLYTYNKRTGKTTALTSGSFEVQQAKLSNDRHSFYISTNEVHPGEQQLYKLTIATLARQRLTPMTGASQVSISPDEKQLAYLYSNATTPWELYLQENKVAANPVRVTDKALSTEFRSYQWKDPEVVGIPAADGKMIYARLYKPANAKPGMPAVFFVHGAGYLQNAHKWWSSYFREYMFNNLLADNGYYVLDIDYRGSAGYGRDWRTGIYRFMGGKDLSDHVDASAWLVKKYGVDPARIGLYGGSYGGFITLMGMFNAPGTFSAGAALRPVTDWAQYNHQYTSNILNEPFRDSIAYRKSSPWYYAGGLKGDLLICHGMVDVNVHYQDAVKLTQRLIELGKDNWELASYPMEDHGFVEPSSWTDEYKRIFKLFERVLKKGQ